jgi:RND superfamily putative drug exporter
VITARKAAALPGGRRVKWVVLVLWILVLFATGSLAGKLTGAEKNDASQWLPKHAESTQALNLTGKFRPTEIVPTIVVYTRLGGITAADRAKATADARAFAHAPRVEGKVSGPVPSRDGKALSTVVNLTLGKAGWNGLPAAVDHLRAIAKADAGRLSAHVTGPGGYTADESKIFGSGGKLLGVTAIIVIIILLLTYRSPLLWILPVLTAVTALTVAQGVIYLLARHAGLTVNGQSQFILIVLVMGAVTDYSLLLTARYREELRRNADRHQAMAVALRRVAPAIIASALTVAVAMLCLLAAQLNSTKGLGPVCAIGVGVGLLAALTLLPALLAIFGRWIFWPKRPDYGTAEPASAGFWARTGRSIGARPRTVWLATAIVLLALGSGVFGLHANGVQNKDAFWGSKPESVTGEKILDAHFPSGTGSPVQVIGNAPAADAMRTALAATRGITAVTAPRIRGGYAYLEGTLTAPPDSPAAYE